MARGGAWAASAAVMLWWASAGAGAVWLEIPPSGTKCVAEEIRNNVVVIGDYSVLYEHHQVHPTVSVKVICLCPGPKDRWYERNVLRCERIIHRIGDGLAFSSVRSLGFGKHFRRAGNFILPPFQKIF
jgi:hypothetical protein